MSRKREKIDTLWVCDYCGTIKGEKDYGFKKDNFFLCNKCKHISIDSIKRKRGGRFNGFN